MTEWCVLCIYIFIRKDVCACSRAEIDELDADVNARDGQRMVFCVLQFVSIYAYVCACECLCN